MPELPESDANRLRIERHALNRTIEAVDLGNDTSHISLPDEADRARLVGHRFTRTHRHGKYIYAGSGTGPWLAVHLGMSGSLRPYDEGGPAPDYLKLIVRFEGTRRLGFRCPRKLGSVAVIDDPAAHVAQKGLGPDAMEIGAEDFAARVLGGRGAIKAALMAQEKVAGLGNLWSDEILYRTGFMPDARADALGTGAGAALHAAMRRILRDVLDVEADYARLPQDWLIHRRRAGAPCGLCDGTIAKMTVGGRSAYHCPTHQGGAP